MLIKNDYKALAAGAIIAMLFSLIYLSSLSGNYQRNQQDDAQPVPSIPAVKQTTVAPESLAALFGLNLAADNTEVAANTAQAAEQAISITVLAINSQQQTYSAYVVLSQGSENSFINIRSGDTLAGAVVDNITANTVTLNHDGKAQTYYLFHPIQEVGVE